jgi:hypothetical protein
VLVTFGTTILGDDVGSATADGSRIATLFNDLAADSAVQTTPGFRALIPFKAARGNLDGKLSFIATQSVGDREDLLEFMVSLFALVNVTADLTFKEVATTMKCSNAILKGFSRDSSGSTGTRIAIHYKFELTTVPITV